MILASVLVAALAAASPHADRSTPASTARTFYAWHANSAVADDLPGMRAFFTPNLANGLAWAEAAQRCTKSAIIDYDPFGGAQVGITSFAVGATSVHGNAARVTMKLRLWKNMASSATLVMVRAADGWRIADAIDEQGNSIAKTLAGDRAEVARYSRLTTAERTCLARIPF